MRKRAWVSWMLIIAMMTALWPAAVGYALERPVVYPERNDGRESEYFGETERVRVYDNGEKKKVQVMTVPVDEVQALVWRPVSGASYYLYSIRDVDNDEPVIVNEQTANYWINLADMLDWDGPLAYGVTYKIAAAACTSPDDCYWSSEPFYFRLVETVQPEEEEEDPQEEYQGGNNPPPTVRNSHSSTEDQPTPTPNDDDWTTELKTPEPEVQLTGGFAMQSIEIQLGETAGLDGWVHCENGLLERVTYLITDHPVEGDPNNRQYSAELGNVSDVDLATTGELILDTSRAPLNEPGHYQIELYARAVGMEQGVWLANVQVHVYAGEETETHPTPEDNPQPTIDSGHSPTPTPYCVMPAPIVMKADVLNKDIWVKLGETARIEGWVTCEGGLLDRVTYLITDHPVEGDPNNRQYSAALGNVSELDLADANELILDTNRTPLNVPGDYQIEVYAKAVGEEKGVQLEKVQVHVYAEEQSAPTDNSHSPTPTPAPAPQAELKADIMNSSIAVKLGDTARIEGWVTCEGGQLDRVTYLITDHPVEGDPNNRQYSAVLGNVSELDLAEADELILDTNRTPLNAPGDYQIEVYAKAVGMEQGVRLANVQVHVYTGEETETHPTPGNNPPPTVDESRKPGDSNGNTLPPATNDVTTPAPTADLSGVKLQGQFDDDSVELNLGESMRVSGTVACSGDTIVRVTYHFKDHEVSGDPNNRYCTAVLSGQDYVALESLGDLLLDTARDPLNKGGSYTLELWAATARGKAECVDTMTVVVNVICPIYGGAHKMDYTGFEAAHPHKVFRRCACGKAEYTGAYQKMNPCCECGNHYKDGISESAGQYLAHCNKCGMNIALTSTSLLSKGDRGEAVRALQNQLIALGYSVSGGADAIFGSGTEKALTQYQEDMLKKNPALTVSKGVLDVETWKALYGKNGNVTEAVSACQHNGKRENVKEVKTVEYTNITAVNHDVVVSTYEEYTCLECGEKVSRKVSAEAPVTQAHKADVDSPQCVCGRYIGKSAAWYTEGLDGALYNTRAEAVNDIVNRARGQIIDTSKYDNLLNRTNYYYQCNIITTDDLVKCVTMLTNAYVNHEFFAADGDIAKYGVGADGSITAQKMFSQTVGDIIVKYAGTAVFDSPSKAIDPCFSNFNDTMDQLTKNLGLKDRVFQNEIIEMLDLSKAIEKYAGKEMLDSYENFKKTIEGVDELFKIVQQFDIDCNEEYYNAMIGIGKLGKGNEEGIDKKTWDGYVDIYKKYVEADLKRQESETGLDHAIASFLSEHITVKGNKAFTCVISSILEKVTEFVDALIQSKEFYDFFAARMNMDYDKTIDCCNMLRNSGDLTWELAMAEVFLRAEVSGSRKERCEAIIGEYVLRQGIKILAEEVADKQADKLLTKVMGPILKTTYKLTAEASNIVAGTDDILGYYRKMEGQYNNYKTLYANYERLWAEYEKYPDDANRKKMMESALKSSLYCIIDAAESYYKMVDTIDRTVALRIAQAIFGRNADIEELKTMIKYEIDSKKELLAKLDAHS